MPDRKSAKRKRSRKEFEARARAEDAVRAAMYRNIGKILRFCQVCGRKPCLRAGHCAGEVESCFHRMWAEVPEDIRLHIQGMFQAHAAGMSPTEAVAEADRRVQRWRETMARCDEAAAPMQPLPRQPQLEPPALQRPQARPQPRVRSL
jgi:hypothetical protein